MQWNCNEHGMYGDEPMLKYNSYSDNYGYLENYCEAMPYVHDKKEHAFLTKILLYIAALLVTAISFMLAYVM